MSRAVPAHADMWMSCPHACMTGTSWPAAFFVVAVLAKASPVFSATGSASSSVRSITVGPAPFFMIATMPVLPTPVVTSKPSAFMRAASFAAVCVSWNAELGVLVQVLVERLDVGVDGVHFRRERSLGREAHVESHDED